MKPKSVTPFIFMIGIFLIIAEAFLPSAFPASPPNWTKEEFERRFPPPSWFSEVNTQEVNTREELQAAWHRLNEGLRQIQTNKNDYLGKEDQLVNKIKQLNRQFLKSAYLAVRDHPSDADLIVNAVNFTSNLSRSYPPTSPRDWEVPYSHMLALQEYVLEHHFMHQGIPDPYIDPSSGEVKLRMESPADDIGGIVFKTVGLYNEEKRYDSAIGLSERLFKERGHELNDHLSELLTVEYAFALREKGDIESAKKVLLHAIETYKGSWEFALRKQLDIYEAGGHAQTIPLFLSPKSEREIKKTAERTIQQRGGGPVAFGMSKERVMAIYSLGWEPDTRKTWSAADGTYEEIRFGVLTFLFKEGKLVRTDPPELMKERP